MVRGATANTVAGSARMLRRVERIFSLAGANERVRGLNMPQKMWPVSHSHPSIARTLISNQLAV